MLPLLLGLICLQSHAAGLSRQTLRSLPGFDLAPEPPRIKTLPLPEIEKLGEDLRDAVASPPSRDRFLQALRDPDPGRRGQAVADFGYRGNFAAIPYVSAVLLRLDEEVSVRLAAAEALGRIGDRRAWWFLARSVADTDPRLRFASALALAELDGCAPASRALAGPLSDPEPMVRAAAGLALARCAGPAAGALLTRAMEQERDAEARAVLAQALDEAKRR